MASGPVERVLASLRGRDLSPRRTGNGWESRCPSHNDRTPSLSISEGDDGRVLLDCKAGCSFPEVVSQLGMTQPECFVGPATKEPRASTDRPRRRSAPSTPRPPATAYPDSDTAARAHRGVPPRSPDQTWDYTDATGNLVGRIVRWNMPDGCKEVKPVLLLESGKWAAKGMPVPRPLYRLPELLESPQSEIVYVVEGEKCADAAAACGMLATTGSHGADSAKQTDWEPLRGRDVVVLPDADGAGEKWAGVLSGLLTAAGAQRVRVVHLSAVWPDIPKGGDIADYLAECGGDVEQTLAGVQRAIERCSDRKDVGDGNDGKDESDAMDVSEVSDEKDVKDGTSQPKHGELFDRCCAAFAECAAATGSETVLRPVHRVARVLCEAGQPVSDEAVSDVAAALAQRFPDAWANGAAEAELDLKQAVERYEPSKDQLFLAAKWARDRAANPVPACLAGITSPVARLVFLCSVYLARTGGGREFWVSQEKLADALGGCSQQMVSQSFNHYLIPAMLVEKTRQGRTGLSSDYRLFADAEAIMGGAMPEEGERISAASDPPTPNVLPDEEDDIPF